MSAEVASKELCQRLYELSNWDPELYFNLYGDIRIIGESDLDMTTAVCAYTVGFLLRELPAYTSIMQLKNKQWLADYNNQVTDRTEQGLTPEDALCRLAIQLFENKII